MDLQAEKLSLIQEILNIEDVGLIKDIQKLLKKHKHDWFDDLSDEQQKSVLRALEQLDRGETISHEEAMVRLEL